MRSADASARPVRLVLSLTLIRSQNPAESDGAHHDDQRDRRVDSRLLGVRQSRLRSWTRGGRITCYWNACPKRYRTTSRPLLGIFRSPGHPTGGVFPFPPLIHVVVISRDVAPGA